jgi:endonuclease G, mitochondrial
MLRAGYLFVLLFVASAPLPALADACDHIFAGRQPPAIVDPKLLPHTTALCNDAYASLASGLTRGSLWSAEHLTADDLAHAHGLERRGKFHSDDRVPADDRAITSDYTRSGYDRGHMAPSGDMPDLISQQQSFSLGNVVPQTPALNRDVWEGIESAVRHLAQRRGELYVVTGPLFQGDHVVFLHGHVRVPTSTWKAIYDPAARGAAAYSCTNVETPVCVYQSIAVLEQETGIDPFPAVAMIIKQTRMTLPPPEPSPYGHSGWGHTVRSSRTEDDWPARRPQVTGQGTVFRGVQAMPAYQ